MGRERLGAVLWLGTFAAQAAGAESPPAVTVRLIHPEQQCARLIELFRGTRAPHPAAALSAWKRATVPRRGLSKGWEAAISAFNPEMAGELRLLDQAELVLAFDPDDGTLRWHATLPRDDGTFAALAPALALSGGGSEPPLGTLAVDRLGPPGSPLIARAAEGLILASSRAALVAALRPDRPRAWADGPGFAPLDSCWIVRVDPEGLDRSGPVARRRLAEGLRALGCRTLDAMAALEGETFAVHVTTPFDAPPRPAAAIDPAWLDGLPASSLLAAFAWAIDPGAEAWDRAFALADRIERADPAHAGVAPLRARINLLAATVKVRPEVDLWPHLRGISLAILADAGGQVAGAFLGLHTDGPDPGERIANQVLPRLAALFGLRPEPAGAPDGPRLLGRIRDRPLSLDRRGATVRLAWGEPAVVCLREAPANPGRPDGPVPRAISPYVDDPPRRFGVFWPGRLALAPTLGEPLALSIAEAPPVVWVGRDDAKGAHDVVHWNGLHDLVRRFLDRLLLDPPPGR